MPHRAMRFHRLRNNRRDNARERAFRFIFPSLHSQPTSVAWIQPIRGTISWEGEGIIEWSRSKVP